MLTVQPAPAPTRVRPRRPTAATTAPAKPAANASAKERHALCKALRAEVPLGSHADFRRPAAASDPLALLVEQGASREPELLPIRYGRMVWSLARAHARSGDRIAIAGYLGSSPTFEEALAEFGETYADVTEGAHRQLSDAITAGQLPALLGA